MQSFVYNLNTQEIEQPQNTSIMRLAGNLVLTGMLYTELEAQVSMAQLQPFGYKLKDKGMLLGRMNRWVYDKVLDPIYRKTIGTRLGDITKLAEVSVKDLDMGFFGFQKGVQDKFFSLDKYLYDTVIQPSGLKQSVSNFFGGQKTYNLSDVLSAAKNKNINLGKLTEKELKKQLVASNIQRGVGLITQTVQRYQMQNIAFTLGKAIFDASTNYYERNQRLKYYRRLAGISGQISVQSRNELSYSKQEEHIIMRNIQNAMVTQRIINDQGVFGTNPYMSIYG